MCTFSQCRIFLNNINTKTKFFFFNKNNIDFLPNLNNNNKKINLKLQSKALRTICNLKLLSVMQNNKCVNLSNW